MAWDMAQRSVNENPAGLTGLKGGKVMSKKFPKIIVPPELKSYNQWVGWKSETKKEGKITKPPYSIHTGHKCDPTNPVSYCSFKVALQAVESGEYDGLGFAVTENDPYIFLDLDNCRNPDTEKIENWAQEIVEEVDSYTEESISGTGLHVIVKGNVKLPGGDSKKVKDQLQIQTHGGYFTMTGNHLPGTPTTIENRQAVLEHFIRKHFQVEFIIETPDKNYTYTDEKIIEKLHQDPLFQGDVKLWEGEGAIYTSQSEADLALCNKLVALTGGNKEQIDRVFRQSGLYRDKWERDDYRERTINKSLEDYKLHVGFKGKEGIEKPSQKKQEKNKIKPFQFINALDMDYIEEEFLVEEWLHRGKVGYVIGLPQSWKTWFALDLAVAVATGGKFLGKYQANVDGPGPVLLIQQEDPHAMLKERLDLIHSAGEDRTPYKVTELVHEKNGLVLTVRPFPVYIHTEQEFTLKAPKWVERLDKTIEAIIAIDKEPPRLVIIDPIYSVGDPTDYMALSAQEMLPIKKMREKYGTSFLFVGHPPYKENRVWGGVFLNAWKEFEIFLKVESPASPNVVKVTRKSKTAGPGSNLKLVFDVATNDGWKYDVTVIEVSEKDEQKDKIIALLSDIPGLKAPSIGEKTSIKKTTLYRCLKELEKENRLFKKDKKYYVAPENISIKNPQGGVF